MCRTAELQEAARCCGIVGHRGHPSDIPVRKRPAHCRHPRVAACLRRLLQLPPTKVHEQTQCEEVQHLDATHETAAQEQAEYAAKRRCEHTVLMTGSYLLHTGENQ